MEHVADLTIAAEGGHELATVLSDCVGANKTLGQQLSLAGSGQLDSHSAAKSYRKVLSSISIESDLQAFDGGEISADESLAMWKKLKDAGVAKSVQASWQAAVSAAGSNPRSSRAHAAKLVSKLQVSAVAGQHREEMEQFGRQIDAKCLLHEMVAHKVGNLAYESCKRLDKEVVRTNSSDRLADRLAEAGGSGSALMLSAQRLALLSVFVTGITCAPKHRVRYIRYAIKVQIGMANYRTAATFLQLLIRYAKSNRDKLEAELAICVKNGRRDAVPLTAANGAPVGAVGGKAYTEMLPHLQAAQSLAAAGESWLSSCSPYG